MIRRSYEPEEIPWYYTHWGSFIVATAVYLAVALPAAGLWLGFAFLVGPDTLLGYAPAPLFVVGVPAIAVPLDIQWEHRARRARKRAVEECSSSDPQ
jgi:hypothetical protein